MSSTEQRVPKQARSRETRRRTIEAAYRLFCERGYTVPLTEIAVASGVSVQNLYVSFQNKRTLAREALQHAVHGPGLDLPPHEQPWFREVIAAPDAGAAVRVWVTNLLPVYARVAPLAPMFISEPELADLWARSEELRMFGFKQAMSAIASRGTLRGSLDLESAVQVMFVHLGPLVYQQFVVGMGWTPERWGAFTSELLTAAIFSSGPQPRGPRTA